MQKNIHKYINIRTGEVQYLTPDQLKNFTDENDWKRTIVEDVQLSSNDQGDR